jgi:pimeloyl-ACP methyl ester carboxylesterase
MDFKVLSSRAAAGLQLEKFVTEIGVRQFLLKNLYWIEEGKLGLRPNIAVLKNAAESIGASIASDKQFVKPTLFLKGENSNYINTDSDLQDITRLFPKANITSIKKAGHWLHAENPKDFFDSLTTWLG